MSLCIADKGFLSLFITSISQHAVFSPISSSSRLLWTLFFVITRRWFETTTVATTCFWNDVLHILTVFNSTNITGADSFILIESNTMVSFPKSHPCFIAKQDNLVPLHGTWRCWNFLSKSITLQIQLSIPDKSLADFDDFLLLGSSFHWLLSCFVRDGCISAINFSGGVLLKFVFD